MKNDSPFHRVPLVRQTVSRREFLWRSGGGLGGIALASLLGGEGMLSLAAQAAESGMRPGLPHHKPRAKRVIQMFMGGAASHLDLFDFKPELIKRDGQKSDFGEHVEAFQDGLGPWMKPIWPFKPYGKSGKMLGETVSELGKVVDELAFVHNLVGKTGVHSQATYLQATGFQLPGFPGMGSWVSYGLGSHERKPAHFCGAAGSSRVCVEWARRIGILRFCPASTRAPSFIPASRLRLRICSRARQAITSPRKARPPPMAVLAKLNREHAATREGDARLEARIRSYELAARMQLAAPEAMDISKEPDYILDLYGIKKNPPTWPKEINAEEEMDYFGRKCLAARRLVERGVRFVQIWSGNDNGFPRRNWDSHEDVRRDHGPLSMGFAKGASALIQDLKQRGLLEDTIILWTTEFGRMPSSQGGKGRDHNPYCFTNWLCGGGVKGGVVAGESDQWGYKPLDRNRPTMVYDIHATVLRLLGIEHTKLTFRHNGVDRRLTDVHGEIIEEIIA